MGGSSTFVAEFENRAGAGGSATATANSNVSNGGPAFATATGGNGGSAGSDAYGGNGGAAIANASATNGGSGIAVATGGNGGAYYPISGYSGPGNGGAATATVISTAMQGGSANATATATGGNGGAAGYGSTGIPGTAGVANASSFATTINGYLAQAQSTATGSSGQAVATAQTNFANANTVQTSATSQVGGAGPATALAQVGSGIATTNAITAGQSFSIASPVNAGLLTLTVGSMGAGGIGGSLAYLQTASFMFNAGSTPLVVDLLGNTSLGTGFDSASFQIFDNGNLVLSNSFATLASAQAFFSNNNLLAIQLAGGLNNVQLAFSEMMSGGEGFGFHYATASVSATPLPAAWTMMLVGIVGFGFVAHRRRKGISVSPV
jgi:hypothetical protein